jgi:hypothetical protein
MRIHYKQRMNDTWHPEAECEKQVQYSQKWLAAKQNSDGRQDDGKQVTHEPS